MVLLVLVVLKLLHSHKAGVVQFCFKSYHSSSQPVFYLKTEKTESVDWK